MSRITGTLSVLTIAAIMTACTSAAPTPAFGPIVESIEGTPPASNALTPHPTQSTATETPSSGVPGPLATPTTAPLATAGPTANPIATTAPGTIAPIGTTQTLLPTPQPGAARTPLPTASLTLPPTFTPRIPTATTTLGQPSATPSPTVTPTVQPLLIRKDQGCVDTAFNELYIFGEIVNQTSQAYEVIDIKATVFGAAGAITSTNVSWDMPGVYFAPANAVLPFIWSAQIGQPYNRYSFDLDIEPGPHAMRNDLRIDEFTMTEIDPDLFEIVGKWTNTGTTPVADYISIIATVYDSPARERVSTMGYYYTDSAIELTPGQHTFEGLELEYTPCQLGTGDSLTVIAIGE